MSAADTWDDGTTKSTDNFFNVVPRGIDVAPSAPLPRSRNPSPTIVLAGTRVRDQHDHRAVARAPRRPVEQG